MSLGCFRIRVYRPFVKGTAGCLDFAPISPHHCFRYGHGFSHAVKNPKENGLQPLRYGFPAPRVCLTDAGLQANSVQ